MELIPRRNPLIAVVLIVLQQAAWGAVTGRIAGTITDPSGAAIPGAVITVTNTAQGIKTKIAADTRGDYSFPSLPVGTYDILFEAKGFRSEKRTGLIIDANAAVEQNIALQVAQSVAADFTVQVGAQNLTVEVTGDLPALDTQNSSVGQLVSHQMIDDRHQD